MATQTPPELDIEALVKQANDAMESTITHLQHAMVTMKELQVLLAPQPDTLDPAVVTEEPA